MAEKSEAIETVKPADANNITAIGDIEARRLSTPADVQPTEENSSEAENLARKACYSPASANRGEEAGREPADRSGEQSEPDASTSTPPPSELLPENAVTEAEVESVAPNYVPAASRVASMSEPNSTERTQLASTQISKNGLPRNSEPSPPGLLSLPIDSLHAVASFLSAVDWSALGRCCRGSNRVCREIFRRVRMHGFRCATEVVTAWVRS